MAHIAIRESWSRTTSVGRKTIVVRRINVIQIRSLRGSNRGNGDTSVPVAFSTACIDDERRGAAVMTRTYTAVHLLARPHGVPTSDLFTLVEHEVPQLAAGAWRCQREAFRREIPSSKLQSPNKLQAPNSKMRSLCQPFFCRLRTEVCLVLGA